MPLAATPNAKPTIHPAHRLGLSLVGIAACLLVGPPLLRADPSSEIGLAVLGVLVLWLGVYVWRHFPVGERLTAAADCIARGYLDDAEAILDAVPPGGRTHEHRRIIEIQRGTIALFRGDPARAIAHTTRAIEEPLGLRTRAGERAHVVAARSLRAIAAAWRDDAASALADVGVIRAAPQAIPGLLARASLAEAISLSRANDREALAALLTRDRKLLLEFTSPRERALARALQRSLYAGAGSAYRAPAAREAPVASGLGSWIAAIAPAAAPSALAPARRAAILRSGLSAVEVSPRGPVPSSAPAVPARVGKGKSSRLQSLPAARRAFLLVVLAFLVVRQSLAPKGHGHTALAPLSQRTILGSLAPFLLPVAIVSLLGLAFILFARRRSRRGVAGITAATRLLALDDLAPAERAFAELARRGGPPVVVCAAAMGLAAVAARRARFSEALRLVERPLARPTRDGLPGAVGLRAERAYLLATLDRPSDARAELASLAADYPASPLLATAELRTLTMIAIRAGDLAGAHRLAAQRTPDLATPLFDDTLADIAAVAAEEHPDALEVARLHDDVRADPELRAWLEAVWPPSEDALGEARTRAT